MIETLQMGAAERHGALQKVVREPGFQLVQVAYEKRIAELRDRALSIEITSAETEALKRAIHEMENAAPASLAASLLRTIEKSKSEE